MDLCVIYMFAFLLTVTVVGVDSLQCYACFDTSADNKCGKYETFKNEMGKSSGESEYLKNCTSPYDVACSMEVFRSMGTVKSHIRDCSNGKNFSFENLGHKKGTYARLYQLANAMDNETTCVYDGEEHACLTLCSTGFCNGPVYNHAMLTLNHTPTMLLVLAVIYAMVSDYHI